MSAVRSEAAALETVQSAALAAAGAQAHAIGSAARARAQEIVAAARAEADALRAGARTRAELEADAEERERLARTHAQAHAGVLAAQRSVLVEATAAARSAGAGLLGDPRYEALLEGVAADARERLAGAGAVRIVAAPRGGLIALTASRQLDYSLDATIERCLETMTSELEALWR